MGVSSPELNRLHAQRYPFTLTVVPRSPANPVGAGGGQCWLDALDAGHECAGCGRLPQEGCTCTPQLMDVLRARRARRVARHRGDERRVAA